LAGLFAMHGLSDHGAAGHLEGAGAGVVASHHSTLSHGSATPAELMSSASEVVGGAVVTTLPSGMGGAGGHDLGMAGLCLAVMAASFLLAAAVLRASAVSLLDRVRSLPSDGSSVRPRALDPPDLIQLSIQRC
jgi:hypothetical protein